MSSRGDTVTVTLYYGSTTVAVTGESATVTVPPHETHRTHRTHRLCHGHVVVIVPYAHFLGIPSLLKKRIFGSNQMRVPHGLTHLASCDFNAVFCIVYGDNSFRARRKLDTLSTILSSFSSRYQVRQVHRNQQHFYLLEWFPAVFPLLLPAGPLPLCIAHASQAFQAARWSHRRP